MTVLDIVSPLLGLAGIALVVLGAFAASGRLRLYGHWPARSGVNRRLGVGVTVGGVGILLHAVGRVVVTTTGTVLLILGAALVLVGMVQVLLIVKSRPDPGPDD